MKLYLFELGYFVYPDTPLPIPVPGYLIRTDEGHNILVDTGFPESFIIQPPASEPYAMVARPQDYILNRLYEIGLTSHDIDLVIVSHFDVDHAGNLSKFWHAETVVQRQQYEVAKAGYPRFALTKDQWENPKMRFRLVDGDVEIAPGIELIASSGHVPGHQSLLIRLPKTGPVLLTIDAILNASMTNAETRLPDVSADNDFEARSSTHKLMSLARQQGVKLIVFGDDSNQWPLLKHAPDFYD